MKAKYYIGILLILLLVTSTVKAQRNEPGYSTNDDAKLVVNNYYNDNDYDYSSRINRFHRPYAAFDYYSPVFTDPYLYDYQPWYPGLNIYGDFGTGFNYGFGNYNGYDPYFGMNSYWGNDPFYYNSWFSPFIFSFNFGNRWRNNYWGWNDHNHYYGYNDYGQNYSQRNGYHSYNSNRYSYSGSPSRRNPGSNSGSYTYNNVNRKQSPSGYYSRNVMTSNRPGVRSDNGLRTGVSRRVSSPAVTRQQGNNIRTPGINVNSRYYANNNVNVQNSRYANTGININHSSNYSSRGGSTRIAHTNPGIASHSNRSISSTQVHSSSSRSMTSGSGSRNSSSHSSSRSLGSKSGHSGGHSSGRR